MCTICCGIFPNIQCDMYTQCIFNLICFIQLHQVMIEFKELIDTEAKKYGRNKLILHLQVLLIHYTNIIISAIKLVLIT